MTVLEFERTAIASLSAKDRVPDLAPLDLTVARDEPLALIGERGGGPSLILAALAGEHRDARIAAGGIWITLADGRRQPLTVARRPRGHGILRLPKDLSAGFALDETLGRQMARALRRFPRGADPEAWLDRALVREARRCLAEKPATLPEEVLWRAGLCLACAARPRVILVDAPFARPEPVRDAGLLGLLRRFCREEGIALVLCTDDLALAAQIAVRGAVFYAGRLVEDAPLRDLIDRPRHPYTACLRDALPQRLRPGQAASQMVGEMPPAEALPGGCAFHPRCAKALAGCYLSPPELTLAAGRRHACHWPLEPT